jgi:hypothetical protein
MFRAAAVASVLVPSGIATGTEAETISLTPSKLSPVGAVSERYQSYNIEMVEVTGGRFWKPYAAQHGAVQPQSDPAGEESSSKTPIGMNPELYQYRRPIDLTNARLRKLAAALGPAFVRVSGTWANTTYFPRADESVSAPPAGFSGILTRTQWKGVIAFAKDVNGQIVTSFATRPARVTSAASGPRIRRSASSTIPDRLEAKLRPPSS